MFPKPLRNDTGCDPISVLSLIGMMISKRGDDLRKSVAGAHASTCSWQRLREQLTTRVVPNQIVSPYHGCKYA